MLQRVGRATVRFAMPLAVGFFSIGAHAEVKEWALHASHITYTVKFPLKTVRGESTEAKGKGRCETGKCEFLVAAPVKSFKSGDGNRDTHMWEVTKAASHPMVVARCDFALQGTPTEAKANIDLEFAGVKRAFHDVPVRLKWSGNSVDAEMDLTLVLSQYSVERPKLLGVPIEDEVPLHIVSHWQ